MQHNLIPMEFVSGEEADLDFAHALGAVSCLKRRRRRREKVEVGSRGSGEEENRRENRRSGGLHARYPDIGPAASNAILSRGGRCLIFIRKRRKLTSAAVTGGMHVHGHWGDIAGCGVKGGTSGHFSMGGLGE
jgi:hypothetical protein